MAAATDSSSNFQVRATGLTSPAPSRSPWSQIVRGDPESAFVNPSSPSPAQDPSGSPVSDRSPPKPAPEACGPTIVVSSPRKVSEDANEGSPSVKKHAWNKPSNGPGSPVEVGPIMGAALWPALSESTKASGKPAESPKPLVDGSTVSQAPVMPPSPKKSDQNSNANANSTQNHAFPNRQKSFNRRSNNANGGATFSGAEPSQSASDKEQTSKDSTQKNSSDSGSRGTGSNNGNEHPRNSFRRGNGNHQRADNHRNNNYGNRGNARDQERNNYDWNSNRGYGGRDVHQQQRVGPRNFIRPPAAAPFVNLHRGYASPIGYPDMSAQVYYVPASPTEPIPPMSFIPHAPPPAVFFPAPDPQLCALLVKQIEYYFSGDNLCKDIYLRKNMDEQGWVPISVIANFNRVRQLTNSIPFILDSMRGSSVVEIQGDKIRRRNDWSNWLLPPNSPSASNVEPPGTLNFDNLAARIRGVGIEGSAQQTGSRLPQGDAHHEVLSRGWELRCVNQLVDSVAKQ
ncbi:unnamed protein product [Victoria cruziana]